VQSEHKEEQERLEVKERDNMYVVEVELLDYERENIQILFNDGYLVVTAGEAFKKAYYIGRNVLQDNICASFHNGMLKCMLTKSEREYEEGPVEVNIL
jgi:HSP20 family molecular chaperone IbpA